MLALARHKDYHGACIVVSLQTTHEIPRSKSKTYVCLGATIPVPWVFKNTEEIDDFPVFAKPNIWQGSQGTRVISDRRHLEFIKEQRNNYIITEYLPGPEYTIDCFSDRDEVMLFCGGRERVRTRTGISVRSKRADNDLFGDFAERISQHLIFYGACFFQMKRDSVGTLKLPEVAEKCGVLMLDLSMLKLPIDDTGQEPMGKSALSILCTMRL